jgi:hypothetical protein
MLEANRTIRLLVWVLACAIILLTPACDDDPVEAEQDLENLSAVWDLSTTVVSDACDGGDAAFGQDRMIMIQCGRVVSVIMGDGLWGEGTVSGSELDFMCTEEHVDNSGCCSTHYSVGTLSGSASGLSGSLTTNVILDATTCSQSSTCSIETVASLEPVARYDEGCMSRDTFGSPELSDYLLPWRVGRAYRLNNSYCIPTGGHREQQAYDFLIPVGDQILAARSGTVRQVKQDSPDNGEGSDHNHVMIEHEDGTVALYAHLKRNGVIVNTGDAVEAGQPIARAGHSGTTDIPHLHFGVYSSYPPVEGNDKAVNFQNAEGPVDCRGGLVQGATYTAT